MTQSQALLQTIVEGLLESQTVTQINAVEEGESLRLTLYVPEECKGRVFGRGGRTSRSIRTLIRQVAPRHVRRVYLDIESLPMVEESEFAVSSDEAAMESQDDAQVAFTGTEPAEV